MFVKMSAVQDLRPVKASLTLSLDSGSFCFPSGKCFLKNGDVQNFVYLPWTIHRHESYVCACVRVNHYRDFDEDRSCYER